MMMGWMKRTMKLCIWGMLWIVRMMEGALEKLEDGKETIQGNLLQTDEMEERIDQIGDNDSDKRIKQERMLKRGADWIRLLNMNQYNSSSLKNECTDPKCPCIQQRSTVMPNYGIQMAYICPRCECSKPVGLLPCWFCGMNNPDHFGQIAQAGGSGNLVHKQSEPCVD